MVFARDMESSRQVWSSIDGYPGDFNYREFYRDIGYETDYEYIKPYIASNGVRVHTGIKYHRITGKTEEKDYYKLYTDNNNAQLTLTCLDKSYEKKGYEKARKIYRY